MSVSIKDVAKRAGVSTATVSRVMNQSAGVKSSKVQAVRAQSVRAGACDGKFADYWRLFPASSGQHVC